MTAFIGVDGCKQGWFFARLQPESQIIDTGVRGSLSEIVNLAPKRSVIMVDIPIGLHDASSEPRRCDTEARKVLGPPRASSVFPAPIRAILGAETHAAASAKSKQLIGKGISQQSFAIMAKIREVDELLQADRHASAIVQEVHPELCFWALNGRQPMQHNKKTNEGFSERLTILKVCHPLVHEAVTKALAFHLKKDVARDDIADAMVALMTAIATPENSTTLPSTPERDSKNLPMEMVYPRGPCPANW